MRALFSRRAALLIWLPIAAIATLHYASPPHATTVHDVARRLFYLPIVVGGLLGGLRGGLLAAVVVIAVYLPHGFMSGGHHMDPGRGSEKSLEMAFYAILGLSSGWFADRQRALDRRIREQEQQLSRAARLESLGQLTAGLAHEIRNPLHAMRGSAEIVLDAVDEQAPEYKVGQGMLREIDRLSGVLRRFLDFARGAEPARETVSLSEIANAAVGLVSAQAGRQSTTITVSGDGGECTGDRDQLVQVVVALLINALQAMGRGGDIQVEVGARSIAVDNNGTPIPESDRERIFDPFFTTRDDGTGLGLSMAWRIVDQHGGTLRLVDRDGGVRFEIAV